MTAIRRLTAVGIALTMLTGAVLGAGCGETGDSDPTPVTTFQITPAANATAAPATTTEAPTAAATAPTSATSDAGGPLTLVGVNNTFEPEELAAPAGSITIEFDNRDGGVVHNVHIFLGSDNDGESVAETELEVGPTEQTVTFEAEAGEYYYVCDAHPTTMEGTLTVE